MKVTEDTSFHWRNYLKPTPPFVFWVVTTAEAVILLVNGTEIIAKSKPGIILTLLILQTIVGKAVLFFGKIKEEYEKKIVTVEAPADAEIKVTEEIKSPTNEDTSTPTP